MGIEQTAWNLFEACETGGGWAACKAYCPGGASFACQADYAEWMKDLLAPIPDRRYEINAVAADPTRGAVVAVTVLHATPERQRWAVHTHRPLRRLGLRL